MRAASVREVAFKNGVARLGVSRVSRSNDPVDNLRTEVSTLATTSA